MKYQASWLWYLFTQLLVLSFNSIFEMAIFYINISNWCELISVLSIRLSEYFLRDKYNNPESLTVSVTMLIKEALSTRIRGYYFFGFHSHINGVFGQRKCWFKAHYTRIGCLFTKNMRLREAF